MYIIYITCGNNIYTTTGSNFTKTEEYKLHIYHSNFYLSPSVSPTERHLYPASNEMPTAEIEEETRQWLELFVSKQ